MADTTEVSVVSSSRPRNAATSPLSLSGRRGLRRRHKRDRAEVEAGSNGFPCTVRCAIYTRKSTSEGLDQAFNSLDAQREAAEAYVASQKHLGWTTLPDRYDDGGFSGGTIERPALQRLMADIESRRVDCVVVYKVDRLSRSLLDFARIMQLFEQRGVHFVSVTQHFNTADSMGRLTLNILLSFAQFEREIIGERTRDKIAAARRRGQWVGGRPILGYDLDRTAHCLVVNPTEADQVREIFQLYLQLESLTGVAAELARRGWKTKRWITAAGQVQGGRPFDRALLLHLLRNVAYLGKVRHRDEVFEGTHQAIIDQALWDRVHSVLGRNRMTHGAVMRNRHGALLRSLLRCAPCNAAMVQTRTAKRGREYRYYVCTRALKRGYASCPTKSVSAHALEQGVINKLRGLQIEMNSLTTSPIADAAVLWSSEWDSLSGEQRARIVRLLADRVEINGATGGVRLELSREAEELLRPKETA
ncbi:MAG: recombinase family protein [Phycisphaerae bacterium]|nr:recombinase family protein [Phycisphaerae bacterium]